MPALWTFIIEYVDFGHKSSKLLSVSELKTVLSSDILGILLFTGFVSGSERTVRNCFVPVILFKVKKYNYLIWSDNYTWFAGFNEYESKKNV